jgi:hypothetical protein
MTRPRLILSLDRLTITTTPPVWGRGGRRAQGGNNSATRGDSGLGSVEIKPALAITNLRAGTKPLCYELQHANNPSTRQDSEDTQRACWTTHEAQVQC